ncbi:MFS transporter [Nonomuraea wenchangensis]|uniref:MFS transporter n=1 Tax=Nonomuraea wenchangensis TaxID=568860 RepID=UPI00384AA20D
MPPSVDLTALRSPAFRLIALAQLGFVLGEQVLVVAVTVSVLGAGGDAATVGVVLAAKGIASLCLLLLGGVWSDRLPRRRILTVMLAVDAITAGVPLLVTGSLWLAAVMFVLGAAEAFIRPALNAILAGVLEEDQRVSGRALVNICTRLGVITGPAVADGAPAVLPDQPHVRDRAQPGAPARAEPGHVRLLHGVRHGPGVPYAGGLVSSVTMMAWRPLRPGVVAMCAMASYALVPLGLLYAPSVWILFCCYLVAGFGVETYALCWDVAMYREVPDHLIGRITSLAWLSTFGLMPFGQALTGPLTDLAGGGAVLLAAAGLVLVVPPCLLLVAGMPHLRGTRTPRTTSGPPV